MALHAQRLEKKRLYSKLGQGVKLSLPALHLHLSSLSQNLTILLSTVYTQHQQITFIPLSLCFLYQHDLLSKCMFPVTCNFRSLIWVVPRVDIARNDTQILFHLGSPSLQQPLNCIFSSPNDRLTEFTGLLPGMRRVFQKRYPLSQLQTENKVESIWIRTKLVTGNNHSALSDSLIWS